MMVDYKPFDYRYAYYPLEKINKIIPRGDSRHNLMKHIIGGNNYCLLTSRSFPANQNFDRAFISKSLVDIHAASDQTYCFPLYLYEKDNHGTDDDLFAENAPQNSTVIPAQAGIQKKAKMDSSLRWSDGDEIKNFTRKPNFHPEIIKQIAEKLGLAFVADDSCHTREGGYPWTPAFAGVTEMVLLSYQRKQESMKNHSPPYIITVLMAHAMLNMMRYIKTHSKIRRGKNYNRTSLIISLYPKISQEMWNMKQVLH
jgi:hypothetical protein